MDRVPVKLGLKNNQHKIYSGRQYRWHFPVQWYDGACEKIRVGTCIQQTGDGGGVCNWMHTMILCT